MNKYSKVSFALTDMVVRKEKLIMSCKCSSWDMDEGYKCSVTGDRCMFMIPNSKSCAELYGEGPDSESEELKDE